MWGPTEKPLRTRTICSPVGQGTETGEISRAGSGCSSGSLGTSELPGKAWHLRIPGSASRNQGMPCPAQPLILFQFPPASNHTVVFFRLSKDFSSYLIDGTELKELLSQIIFPLSIVKVSQAFSRWPQHRKKKRKKRKKKKGIFNVE